MPPASPGSSCRLLHRAHAAALTSNCGSAGIAGCLRWQARAENAIFHVTRHRLRPPLAIPHTPTASCAPRQALGSTWHTRPTRCVCCRRRPAPGGARWRGRGATAHGRAPWPASPWMFMMSMATGAAAVAAWPWRRQGAVVVAGCAQRGKWVDCCHRDGGGCRLADDGVTVRGCRPSCHLTAANQPSLSLRGALPTCLPARSACLQVVRRAGRSAGGAASGGAAGERRR